MQTPKNLLLKIFLLLLPFLIVAFPIIFYGDFLNSNQVIFLQKNFGIPDLYGPVREDQYRYYKAEMTRTIKPEVVLLGDSRTLEIRRFFFKNDTNFYNAGWGRYDTADFLRFFKFQDTKPIDVAVLCLSQFPFNGNIDAAHYPEDDYRYTNIPVYSGENLNAQLNFIRYNYNDILSGIKPDVFKMKYIGLNAGALRNGAMADGSFFHNYKDGEYTPVADRLADTLARIEKGSDGFEHGDKVNPGAVFYLKELLQFCKDEDIYVIAYAPPFAPAVYDAILAKGDAYLYLFDSMKIIPGIFDEFGFEFYDYTDVRDLGCTDEYFGDGIHGSDVVFLRMFIDMIERGSKLSQYCNIDDLYMYYENRFSDDRLLGTFEEYNILVKPAR